jgi:hypothetical protein
MIWFWLESYQEFQKLAGFDWLVIPVSNRLVNDTSISYVVLVLLGKISPVEKGTKESIQFYREVLLPLVYVVAVIESKGIWRDDDIFVLASTGFGGPECNFEYNECESNPCSNGGTCLDRVGEFQCICPSGYAGSRCETQVFYTRRHPSFSFSRNCNMVRREREGRLLM